MGAVMYPFCTRGVPAATRLVGGPGARSASWHRDLYVDSRPGLNRVQAGWRKPRISPAGKALVWMLR